MNQKFSGFAKFSECIITNSENFANSGNSDLDKFTHSGISTVFLQNLFNSHFNSLSD